MAVRPVPLLLLLGCSGALAWGLWARWVETSPSAGRPAARAQAPVQVAPVGRGTAVRRRTFSGSLEPSTAFVVASKQAGRIVRIDVDLGDVVQRGQVVAHLDDAELQQEVQQAQADLAVAIAGRTRATNAHEVAGRALKRAQALHQDGVTSESALDNAAAEELSARAQVEVAEAQVLRAEATLESARIRLDQARITADWDGQEPTRVVSRRYLDEGGTVSSNTPLLEVVSLDPIVAVVQVPERDYAGLSTGQVATLTTDAYPGDRFAAVVERIAPVFRSNTRLARVELRADNTDRRLRPGMFVRATLELARAEDVTLVPGTALTERDGERGVFWLAADDDTLVWTPVTVGIEDGERVQVEGLPERGRVVVLGQDLCVDGSAALVVPDPVDADAAGGARTP